MKVEYLEKMKDFYSKLPPEQQAEGLSLLLDEIIREKKEKAECGNKKWNKKSSKKLISGSTTHTNPEEKTRTEEKTKTEEKSDSQAMEIVEKKEYGDENVNKCLNMIQSISGTIDGTKKEQRQYASLLIKKLEEIETVKSGEYLWSDILSMILLAVKDDKFYCGKITSPKKIYYDLGTLMQRARTVIKNQQDSNVVLQVV